jgi:hypothetical protein
MADRKISDLTALTTPASGDFLPIVDISEAAAASKNKKITYSDFLNNIPTGTITSTMILDGTILNADINASAAIVDTKLATIATGGKVSNSATTATDANTASAIVARDASGNFSAGTITAALTGAASSNVLKAGDTMTGALVVPLASAATPSLTFTGDLDSGVFSPGANQVAVATNGTGRLFVDASGNVGVGTASPSAYGSKNLEVNGGAGGAYLIVKGASGADIGELGSDGDIYLSAKTASSLILRTSDAERLRITSAGLVGIGVSGPSANLDLAGSSSTSANNTITDAALRVRSNASGTENFAIRHRGASAGISGLSSTCQLIGSGTNAIELYTIDATPVVFGTSATERVRIDSSGRLGIGSSVPSSILNVVAQSDTAGGDGITLGNYVGNRKWLTRFGTNTDLGLYQDFWDGTTWSTKLALTYTGLLGINTASPTKSLEVAAGGTVGGGVLVTGSSSPQILLTASGSVSLSMQADGAAGYFGTATNHPLIFRTNNAERARIDSSGRLLIGTSSARSNSDFDGFWLHVTPNHQFEEPILQQTYAGLSVTCNNDNWLTIPAVFSLGKSLALQASIGSNGIVRKLASIVGMIKVLW